MGQTLLQRLKFRAKELEREVVALYFTYRDPRLPWYTHLFAAFIVARTFSPIDLIPDFIPVLGILDDVILTPIYITLALKMIPSEVMAEARLIADAAILPRSTGSWLYAALVVAIWLLLAAFLGFTIWRLLKNGHLFQ
jgi:uncharacterized membrane protein YkvA (DUF1232 family)